MRARVSLCAEAYFFSWLFATFLPSFGDGNRYEYRRNVSYIIQLYIKAALFIRLKSLVKFGSGCCCIQYWWYYGNPV
jgi:hypothetical protein